MTGPTFTRRSVNRGLAAAGLTILVPRYGRAADYAFRHVHNLPVESPLHKRALEMWAAVRAETNGRLAVEIDRSGTSGLDDLVDGDLAFMTLAGNGIAALVPPVDVQATPYAYRDPAQVYRALDGDLGAYLAQEMRAKGVYAVPGGCFENGMHQITSTHRPIRNAADMQGLKIRIPGTRFYQDYFRMLGSEVHTMPLPRVYDALKANTVEAQDDPWDVVELFKFYEVQRYASVTDHSWSGYNMIASLKIWDTLPADIRSAVETNVRKYALLQRNDMDSLNEHLRHELEQRGMVFNTPDLTGFRETASAFFPGWRDHIGQRAWDLLQTYTGPLR